MMSVFQLIYHFENQGLSDNQGQLVDFESIQKYEPYLTLKMFPVQHHNVETVNNESQIT